ncbi:single-stranded DNA-binding protein [Patescibacteria group bacterium]|nr:single-stranded DNA-binding protein [Patescibacteria group bacterium]
MDLNKAMIIGRLTRDPEGRTTPSGQTVCTFGMATNRVWTDATGTKQEKVDYHNIVAWGKLGDICTQYLKKGRKIYIEGRIQTRDWEAQDGTKKNRTELIAENMIMLESKSSQNNFAPKPAAQAKEDLPVVDVNADTEEQDIKVEDIPF